MADCADWRNPSQTFTNSPLKKGLTTTVGNNAKDRKFENLESNVQLGEEATDKHAYNPNLGRSNMGTDANWSAQAGRAKLDNNYSRVDTYQKRQQQLASQVFEGGDYSHHAPLTKKGADINNMNEQQKRDNHNFSDAIPQTFEKVAPSALDTPPSNGLKASAGHATGNWADTDTKFQIKKNYASYSNIGQKLNEQKSVLDTHTYEPEVFKSIDNSSSYSQLDAGKGVVLQTPSKAVKAKDLASNLLGHIDCPISKYSSVKNAKEANSQVVEMIIHGLPQSAQSEDLKRISGIKHIIEATVEVDTIANMCTGTGKLKVRLGDGEDVDQLKLQLIKAGLDVRDIKTNQSKKHTFTYKQALIEKSPATTVIDAKMSRVQSLQSTNPDVFGNSGSYQTKFTTSFDHKDASNAKRATLIEKLALSTWSKVANGGATTNSKKIARTATNTAFKK